MAEVLRRKTWVKKMHGSITRLNEKIGCGFILGEDGCELYFDLSSLEGIDIRMLSIGKAVEYQEQRRHERLRAVRVRLMQDLRSEAASGG